MAKALRFAIVPKIAHPWFDEVHQGARAQAALLSRELGVDVQVDYLPPSIAGVVEQNRILEELAESHPSGVAIDPVVEPSHLKAITHLRDRGVPVVLFDSPSPEASLPSIGNDFAEQGRIAAERLVQLIGSAGKVAVMQGYPTAPNHKARYEAQLNVLKKHQDIHIVDGGTDNDDIEVARQEALTVLEKHPDLTGYLCCDASGPIGIATALRQTGKAGKVKVVGMDGIRPILETIRDGVLDSSSATKPRMQGSMAILMLWELSLGIRGPKAIDTGIDVITRENVDFYLTNAA